MAAIGAATRLTESGLSIVDWKPFTGAVPPLSDTDWQTEFQKYQTSPQYQKINTGMTLDAYKAIFWWEWVHRQWGRLIGLVYAAGLAWFWFRHEIPQRFKRPMLGILALGGAQGAVGWVMVASGLVDSPAVSHYKLAAHLLLALALYVACIWLGLNVRDEKEEGGAEKQKISPLRSPFSPLYKHAVAALWLVILTITWGAFVAGLRAGLLYNTWPLMDGHLVPPDFWFLSPWWINFFENHGAVQFTHRMLAYVAGTMCMSIALVVYVRKVPKPAAIFGYAVGAMGFLQMALGIVTVITQVKIHPAVTHQVGAFVLVALLIFLIRSIRSLGDYGPQQV